MAFSGGTFPRGHKPPSCKRVEFDDTSQTVPNDNGTMRPTRKTRKENYFAVLEVCRGPQTGIVEKSTFRNRRIDCYCSVIDVFHYFSCCCSSSFLMEPRCTRLGEFNSLSEYLTQRCATKTTSGFLPPSWKHTVLNWDNVVF